jgi:hypothetical protein
MDVPTVKRIALALVAFTLLYNVAEGALSIWSGVRADSLVLLTFGADSYVEVLAAGAVLWRLVRRRTGGRAGGTAGNSPDRRDIPGARGSRRLHVDGVTLVR